ncbi:MAG: M64 family metallopeptidase [Deltaproteobacteria bacterium]|nr:M64 family metallopeptidase [Kofleriaceae bacterium]
MPARRLRHFWIAVLIAGCTASPPAAVEYVLEVRVTDGAITEVTPILTGHPGEHGFAQPRGTGNLRAELVGQDWSGAWPVRSFVVAEELSPSRNRSQLIARGDRTVYVAIPADPGATELRVRLTLEWPERAASVVERTFDVRGPSAARAPLVEADVGSDVGGAREALSLCLNDDGCPEGEFCAGVACRVDECWPEDGSEWDAQVTDIAGSGAIRLVFFPLGPWGSPAELEAEVTRMVTQMTSEVDWFVEHGDAFTYSVFRGDCFDGSPSDFGEALSWIESLPSRTRLLPGYDILIGVHPGDIRAAANDAPGNAIVLARADSGYVLAHELGHAFGGLGDEYFEVWNDSEILFDVACGVGSLLGWLDYPNISRDESPPWACDFGGQACPGGGGVVGAYRGGSCAWFRPCPTSIMSAHEGNQFDPVGVAAMDHMLEHGTVLQHGTCECDASCDDVPEGTCALNDCFGICDRCGGTDICWDNLECLHECSGHAGECRDVFDQAHCRGDSYIVDLEGTDGTPVTAVCSEPTAPADCARIDGVDECTNADGCGYMACSSECVPDGSRVSIECGCANSFWPDDCAAAPGCTWDGTACVER